MKSTRYRRDRIGNHLLKPETMMLGYGYDPELSEGAVKPPVFLTSTFVFRSAEEGRDFFNLAAGRSEPEYGVDPGLVYSRFNHPNSEIVEDRLAIYEAAEIGAILDQAFDIAVRPGLHCAPYIHLAIGSSPDGAVRASPGAFSTSGDVDRLADALAEIKL